MGGERRGVDRVDDYVVCYCHHGMQKRSNKLTIGQVMDLTLRTFLVATT
jgi:hypothetical protein